jgi:excisionase family DNA binding protein
MTTRPNTASYAQRQARVAAQSGPGDKLAYSIPEAAHALGISESTVWEMVKLGSIRKFKIGARVLIKREELQRVIEAAEACEAA